MIVIDYQSRTPIYEQIVLEIERYVVLGVYKPKQQIESIRELATSLGINPNTVKKAYDELERRGTITTISTKGTFISENTKGLIKNKIEEKIKLIQEEIKELEKLGLSKKEIIEKL
ncbi:MAG: GntR family transcriptional regulator [Clostridia bacterium]|nr:GntR family transcriptional regulator [Clostridia bacterium]